MTGITTCILHITTGNLGYCRHFRRLRYDLLSDISTVGLNPLAASWVYQTRSCRLKMLASVSSLHCTALFSFCPAAMGSLSPAVASFFVSEPMKVLPSPKLFFHPLLAPQQGFPVLISQLIFWTLSSKCPRCTVAVSLHPESLISQTSERATDVTLMSADDTHGLGNSTLSYMGKTPAMLDLP